MSIVAVCLACNAKLRAPQRASGRLAKCPRCGSPVAVRPALSEESGSDEAAERAEWDALLQRAPAQPNGVTPPPAPLAVIEHRSDGAANANVSPDPEHQPSRVAETAPTSAQRGDMMFLVAYFGGVAALTGAVALGVWVWTSWPYWTARSPTDVQVRFKQRLDALGGWELVGWDKCEPPYNLSVTVLHRHRGLAAEISTFHTGPAVVLKRPGANFGEGVGVPL